LDLKFTEVQKENPSAFFKYIKGTILQIPFTQSAEFENNFNFLSSGIRSPILLSLSKDQGLLSEKFWPISHKGEQMV
jgi:hypothetical protein